LSPTLFIAPEIKQDPFLDEKEGWDIAVRYQDIRRLGNLSTKDKKQLKKQAIKEILRRAYHVVGAVLKPEKTVSVDFQMYESIGRRGDIDVLSSAEEILMNGLKQENLRFEIRVEKERDVLVMMDASLSMRGEKLALLSVAAAVVALCVPEQKLSFFGFDSQIRKIKFFSEPMPVEKIVEKILELPAGGFTNLELALKETLSELSLRHKDHANVILISDGKYTEGKDPLYLASYFKHLHCLKIGRDQGGRELLLDLVLHGSGHFFETRSEKDIPKALYKAIRALNM